MMLAKLKLMLMVTGGFLLFGGTSSQEPPTLTSEEAAALWEQRFVSSLFNLNRPGVRRSSRVVQHEWAVLEYDWSSECVKDFYTQRGRFDPETIFLHNLDVYKGDVYVTLYHQDLTIPAGLNKVVVKDGRSLLQPFPNLLMNEHGLCSSFQDPVSCAIDPNTGLMYVLDGGDIRRYNPDGQATLIDRCPPKLVVLDLNDNGAVVRSHDFPPSVMPPDSNFLSELVLDYVSPSNQKVQYAYMSDWGNRQLVVFDFNTNKSWAFKHESMEFDENNVITINNKPYTVNISINGLAMDSKSEYVYYCALGSLRLYQIPTFVLRDPTGDFDRYHRMVGVKVSQSDGLVFGKDSLFFGAESMNAVYRWNVSQDMETQNVTAGQVTMETQTQVAKDDFLFRWVDGLKLDGEGYLWFTTNRVYQELDVDGARLDFTGTTGSNFRVNRVFVGENSYLHRSP